MGRFVLMAALPLLLVAGGTYMWVTGGRYEETENANLRQARVTIASESSGRIVQANIGENQKVQAGDVLFVVDPEPYRIALAQAEAALATARLNVEQLRSAYSQAQAKEKVTASDVRYYQSELDRQQTLTQKGVGTQSALDSARRDLVNAEDEHAAAVDAVSGALAALGGDPTIATDSHPVVLAALAARDQAALNLKQTTVTAPTDGVISQASSFKPGQYVNAGTSLFTLVETGDTWVEANFKETQLTHMKRGQKAEVTLDTFPDRPLIATVDTIGAGTGAEFSLLPAQNATGNWVKVTQRIPVRLKITSDDVEMLMRTGMSATVSVDTGVARGWPKLFGTALAGQ
ncbi:MAG: HlyD family secretion protein [Rhizobiaceae bacterium]|nr:HlyD family secretion protein [Rhizobiaceae bacterium]